MMLEHRRIGQSSKGWLNLSGTMLVVVVHIPLDELVYCIICISVGKVSAFSEEEGNENVLQYQFCVVKLIVVSHDHVCNVSSFL